MTFPKRVNPQPEEVPAGLKRSSQVSIHDGKAEFTCVCDRPFDGKASVEEQTRQLLARADARMAGIGIDKRSVITVLIVISNVAHFDAMNSVWDAWVDPDHLPSRMCIISELASPDLKVEMKFTAAV